MAHKKGKAGFKDDEDDWGYGVWNVDFTHYKGEGGEIRQLVNPLKAEYIFKKGNRRGKHPPNPDPLARVGQLHPPEKETEITPESREMAAAVVGH